MERKDFGCLHCATHMAMVKYLEVTRPLTPSLQLYVRSIWFEWTGYFKIFYHCHLEWLPPWCMLPMRFITILHELRFVLKPGVTRLRREKGVTYVLVLRVLPEWTPRNGRDLYNTSLKSFWLTLTVLVGQFSIFVCLFVCVFVFVFVCFFRLYTHRQWRVARMPYRRSRVSLLARNAIKWPTKTFI
jgi:hypothetical protein